MPPCHRWQVSPDTLAPEMAEGTSYIFVRLYRWWRSSGVAQVTTTKHQVVYPEPPVVAQPLTCPSVICARHVSADTSPGQICTDVDIQITSQTDLAPRKPTLLWGSMWWAFSGCAFAFSSVPQVSHSQPRQTQERARIQVLKMISCRILFCYLWIFGVQGYLETTHTPSPCVCTPKKIDRPL